MSEGAALTREIYLISLVQHLTIAGIGLMIAVLGYRMFRDMPALQEGSARIGLPGGISIFWSRVGPGAFFVLFGTGLIAYTAPHLTFTYRQGDTSIASQGFGNQPAVSAPAAKPGIFPGPRPDLVRLLADLATETDKQPLSQQRIDRDRALSEARRAIMLAAWDPRWGNPEDFQQWLNSGGSDPPGSAAKAVAVFNGQ